MLPYRGEPSQFLQGLWSDGNSVHCVRISEMGHELPFAVTRNQVCNAAMNGWGGWLLLHPASRCAIMRVSSSTRKGATRCKLRQLASI